MKAYACFWPEPYEKTQFFQAKVFNTNIERFLKINEYSFNSFGKTYEAKIITNTKGLWYLKKYTKISQTNIIKYFDFIDDSYCNIWSLAKLYCYKQISQIGDPFIFFDLDLFLLTPLPIDYINSEVFAYDNIPNHNVEDWGYNSYLYYILNNKSRSNNKFINNLIANYLSPLMSVPLDNEKHKSSGIPNVCIFGGKNLDLIKYYADTAIKNVIDPENKEYWIDFQIAGAANTYGKACIAEQLILGLICAQAKDLVRNEYSINNINLPFNKIKNELGKCGDVSMISFLNHFKAQINFKGTFTKHLSHRKDLIYKKSSFKEILDRCDGW